MVGGQGSEHGAGTVLITRVRGTLLVLYTERLDACREFYSGIGLHLVGEQHGSGPVHYAAELVLELYPGRPDHTTGRLRLGLGLGLGLTVQATDQLTAGEHHLTDPDSRVVIIEAIPQHEYG